MPTSLLFATATPTLSAIPISDGSGDPSQSLDLWVSSGSGGGGGSGTVTTVSVASANGFAGSVANASTTPAISISTSVSGILHGNGTSVAAAIAANFPTLNQNTTGSAATLTTPRTLAITGDLAWTSPSFDGSANVTAAGTLASTAVTPGSYTNADITVDAKGRVTAAANGSGGGGTPGGSTTQVQYNNAGAFGGISGFTTDGTNATAGSGNLRATSPRITTSLFDTNGVTILGLTATGSAVNWITTTNAATGNNPIIGADGGGTNLSIFLQPKGTGNVTINGTNPAYSLAISGTGKGVLGIAAATDGIIVGSVTDDFCYRSIASKSHLWSINDGTSWQMKLATSTGQATVKSTTGNHNQFFLDTTDAASSSTWINFQRGGTTYARTGTVGAAGNLIVGSAVGEMALVAFGARMLFSADSGTTLHMQLSTAGALAITGGITTGSTTLHATSVALTNGAAAQLGTLTNSPSAGNPTKWVPVNDNGTTRYCPLW